MQQIAYNEAALIALLKKKDRSSFDHLYNKYSGSLYFAVLKIIPDKQTACEILQDVFVKIWLKIDTYDSEKGRLFTWMFNIARNLSVDILRSKTYQTHKSLLEIGAIEYTEGLV
jgi:RNA polymerase sigma factor (sigma-70 family)